MSNVLQEILVGLAALGAAAFVGWRIYGAVRPKSGAPTCDACAMHDTVDPKPTSR
jgi:hypothetical protein